MNKSPHEISLRRFILTGAPGAGKTTLLRELARLGYSVVEEAATEIIAQEQGKGIAEPWTKPSFIDLILNLQEQRQNEPIVTHNGIQFFDRAPLDTLVLCRWLGYPVSPELLSRFQSVQEAGNFERQVLFIDDLGYIEKTEARRISYEDAVRFGKLHEEIYTDWGYTLQHLPALSVPERVAMVLGITALARQTSLK